MTLLLFALLAPAHALPAHLADSVATGDCATVLEALTTPTTAEERLVAGRCAVRRGAPDRAVALLAPLTTGDVWSDYAALVRGDALLALERFDEAAAALSTVKLPGLPGRRARLLHAVAQVRAGKSLEARDALRALLEDDDLGTEARYWLAWGAEQRGDLQPAIATYRATWTRAVHGDWAERSAARLAALGAPIDDLSTAEARGLALERFQALRRAYQGGAALELLTAVRAVDPVTSDAERLQWAKACFAGRDYGCASAAYTTLMETSSGRATAGVSGAFDWALATSRTGDYDLAAERYRQLRVWYPGTKQADTASFKLGFLHYDALGYEAARTEFARHLGELPGSEHSTEALWFSAWSAFKLGRLDDAEADLDALLRRFPKSSLVPGCLYWKARIAGLKGNAEAEKDGLADVIRRYPVSGYAWFAARRTGRSFAAHEAVPRPAWPESFAARDAVKRGEALLGAGLRDWARLELEQVARQVSGDRAASLAAAHALIAAGDYQRGQRLAQPYCTSVWKTGDPVAQQACTARPEAGIVTRTAARYDLDPLVPYGIMITESALDPTVTSLAGARGLMQLMPVEAERLHRELYGDRPYDPDALYTAPYNASLGVAELGGKLRDLDGLLGDTSLPAAIAAYNGGETAVRRWAERYDETPDFDVFAEDIGFTETRRYVKSVLGHTMRYRWVYGDPD